MNMHDFLLIANALYAGIGIGVVITTLVAEGWPDVSVNMFYASFVAVLLILVLAVFWPVVLISYAQYVHEEDRS